MRRTRYRSTHRTADARRPGMLAAIPVALAALTSLIAGTSAAHADTPQPVAKPPQFPELAAPQRAAQSASGVSDGKTYTVVAGDTVRGIATLLGVSTAELLAANGLSWKTLIFAGQQLRVPEFTHGTPSAEVRSSIRRHHVVAGDTLEAIARNYGVQGRAIMTANGLDRSSRLVVGQRLVIPDAEIMSALPADQTESAPRASA
jgi:LysM repeat protein